MAEDSDERRKPAPAHPLGYLDELPARVLLDRLPTPMIVVDSHDSIVYRNRAFDDMLGCRPAEHVSFHELIVSDDPQGPVVDFRHDDGFLVHAIRSEASLPGTDEPTTVVCFLDITERLWADAKRRE